MKTFLGLTLAFAGAVATAAVTGNKVEKFGTDAAQKGFVEWLNDADSLVTPEVTNLAVQSCLRKSQRIFDTQAAPLTARVVDTLEQSFRGSRDEFGAALASLADLARSLEAIPAKQSGEYETSCRAEVARHFSAQRGALLPLYLGRMAPKADPELVKRGLEVVPLTWDSLTDQICKLEGYYSESNEPELWKFFSVSRVLSNVLPSDEKDAAFRARVTASSSLVEALRTLDRYGAVAGKVNGNAIGLASDKAPARLTGPAAGSRASQLLATFTTAWRERLQALTFSRPYPAKPFALLSSEEVLSSLEYSSREAMSRGLAASSQTETGMLVLWNALAPKGAMLHGSYGGDYGAETVAYRKTAALAWLALNAETNLRANEKLPGVRYAAVNPEARNLFGAPAEYRAIGAQIEGARAAFAVLPTTEQDPAACLDGLQRFVNEAAQVPAKQIGRFTDDSAATLSELSFHPITADIGLEVEDDHDGRFRLALANGYGHVFPAEIEGRHFELWTPSAIVMHTPQVMDNGEWKSRVREFDSLR